MIHDRLRPVRRIALVVVAAMAAVPLLATVGAAHPMGAGPPPTAHLSADGERVEVVWTAQDDDVADLAESLGLVPEGTSEAFLGGIGPSPLEQDEREALSREPALAEAFAEGVAVEQDGVACDGDVDVAEDALADGATMTFACPAPVTQVDVTIDLLHDLDPGYRTVGLVGDDPPEVVSVFTASAPAHTIDLDAQVTRSGVESLAAWPTAGAGWLEDRLVGLADVEVGWAGLMLALLVAAGIGAAHALAPGHAKTVTAAYLAGGSARARHALAVGAVVAFMHTATVLVIAATLVLLPWSPDLGPATGAVLTIVAGTVLLLVGVSMLRRRFRSAGRSGHAHDHAVDHHSPLSRRGLVAVGTAGGLLPSPSALLVLSTTWLAGRPVVGLALVAAFGLGLALTIAGVGLAAGAGRRALDHHSARGGPAARIAVAVPGVAAAVVTIGGAWLAGTGVLLLTAG